jgi:maltose alpha-D-glucosyltransferase/alpha-amylase
MSTLQQRSLYQAIRSAVRSSTTLLRRKRSKLREKDAEMVDLLLEHEGRLLEQLKSVTAAKIECDRIRIHGDYHLGQVLHTGKDFVIIDFEGEPQRPLSQRRLKRLALRDVAGMVRSYHYATLMAFHQMIQAGLDEESYLDEWAHTMHRWLSSSFLDGYREVVEGTSVVPSDPGQFRLVLDALLVEKAAYELEYELNNRPDWIEIPLRGILETID